MHRAQIYKPTVAKLQPLRPKCIRGIAIWLYKENSNGKWRPAEATPRRGASAPVGQGVSFKMDVSELLGLAARPRGPKKNACALGR